MSNIIYCSPDYKTGCYSELTDLSFVKKRRDTQRNCPRVLAFIKCNLMWEETCFLYEFHALTLVSFVLCVIKWFGLFCVHWMLPLCCCRSHIFNGLNLYSVLFGESRARPSFPGVLKENWLTRLSDRLWPFSNILIPQDHINEKVNHLPFCTKLKIALKSMHVNTLNSINFTEC